MKPPGRWKSLSEIEARQRNTVWPDTLRNGALVDAFVWRGSPNATYIQRIGTALFGLLFLCPAVLLMRFRFFEVGPALDFLADLIPYAGEALLTWGCKRRTHLLAPTKLQLTIVIITDSVRPFCTYE